MAVTEAHDMISNPNTQIELMDYTKVSSVKWIPCFGDRERSKKLEYTFVWQWLTVFFSKRRKKNTPWTNAKVDVEDVSKL